MVAYLKTYIEKMLGGLQRPANWKVLGQEIDRLDPRDFEPGVRAQLLIHKAEFIGIEDRGEPQCNLFREVLDNLSRVLNGYLGEGSSVLKRSFPYLTKPELRRIIERDYAELNLRLFPGHAWKSAVIIAGSILEAILHDVLSAPNRVAQTNASTKGAKAKGGVPIDITVDPDAWKLVHLIEVATDTGILPSHRADTVDQVLRDYRNFVHPLKEIQAGHECGEVEAGLAKYALDGVCDHLANTL
jgi:hypothetical protein